MPELVAGANTRIAIKSDSALVGRRSRDGSFIPDIDLADLEGGQTVSRSHARVYRDGGTWRLQVEPAITNETIVAGRSLAPGEQVALGDGDEIRLGKVSLVFRVGIEAPPPNPDATMVRAVEAPAELRSGDQVFPLSAPDGRSLSLGRHPRDRSYRPDVDLGDLEDPDHPTVSRRHAQLFTRNGQWMMRIETTTTNATQQNGTQLAFEQEVSLSDGDQLQFGRVVATFHLARQVGAAGELIELILDPPRLAVEAGVEAPIAVTIINHTGHVDYFNLELEGIPRDWYRILLPNGQEANPALVQLFNTPLHGAPAADATAKLRIVIAPPRACQSRAGVHPLTISATTQGEPRMRRVVPSQLTIGRFESLRFDVAPEQIRGGRGTYLATLQNLGNDVAVVVLSSEGQDLVHQWERPQVLQGAPLASCAKDQVGLTARVKRRHWLGPDRTYNLTLSVVAGTIRESRSAELTCPPRIPWWLQTLQQRIWQIIAPVWAIALPLIILIGVYLLFLQPPKIVSFDASAHDVVLGQPVNVTWKLSKPARVAIDGPNGEKYNTPDAKSDGEQAVKPPIPLGSYRLTVCNQFISPTSPFPILCSGQDIPKPINVTAAPLPAQIVSFSADKTSLPKEGSTVNLAWSFQNVITATLTSSDPNETLPPISAKDESGSGPVTPSMPVTYTLTVESADGHPRSANARVVINPPEITFNPVASSSVLVGSAVHLTWQAQGFTTLVLEAKSADTGQPVDVVAGQQKVPLTDQSNAFDAIPTAAGTIQYVLTATNGAGPVSKTQQVTVVGFHADFTASPMTITAGQPVTLKWSAPGAKAIKIDPLGSFAPDASPLTENPAVTTTYTFTAAGPDGTTSPAIPITITVGPGKPTYDFFTAAPTTINKGDKATLTFSVQNAKRVTIQGSDGKSVLDRAITTPNYQGNVVVSPTDTTTYTLTVTNDAGQAATPAVVTVAPPTPTPAPSPPAAGGAAGGGSGGGGGGGGGGPTPTPKH